MSGSAWERDEVSKDPLDGMEMKFTVLKNSDINQLSMHEKGYLGQGIAAIRKMRAKYGKKENNYIMINTDEPYVGEIIEIMKRHGHWS